LLLLPPRRRPGAPEGHTPLMAYHDKPARVAALAARTVSPKRPPMGLYIRWPPHTLQALEVAACLRARWQHLRGHLIRLGDRGSMPRGPAIEAVCQAHPRLQIQACPASAPALNPTEQVGTDFKAHPANSRRRDPRELRHRRSANTRWVRRSQATLRSFMCRSKWPAPP
jgi:hypothetical protein